jgi:hypothetical protein
MGSHSPFCKKYPIAKPKIFTFAEKAVREEADRIDADAWK